MNITLRALSATLLYPSAELCESADAIRMALQDDGELSARSRDSLQPLLSQLESGDLLELQEHYVDVFDRGRAHCLHLFEHVHGESRDRGQAMVDLRQRYLEAGLEPVTNELPDYLPLFLEYCSVLSRDDALEQLRQPGPIIAALADRLESKGTPYAGVLAALCDVGGIERNAETAAAIVPPDNPHDLAELDKAWEAEEVTFGTAVTSPTMPGQSPGCSTSTDDGVRPLPMPRLNTSRSRNH